MIGVGPVHHPAAGGHCDGRSAGDAWLGARRLLALCDGLVWAELGAVIPQAGGSYAFCATSFPVAPAASRLPLSSGSSAFQRAALHRLRLHRPRQYATYLARTRPHTAPIAVQLPHVAGISFGPAPSSPSLRSCSPSPCSTATSLRHAPRRFHGPVVLAPSPGSSSPASPTSLQPGLQPRHPGPSTHTMSSSAASASAMLIATYDYWGYYNIMLPRRRGPRPRSEPSPARSSISICIVAALYHAHEHQRARRHSLAGASSRCRPSKPACAIMSSSCRPPTASTRPPATPPQVPPSSSSCARRFRLHLPCSSATRASPTPRPGRRFFRRLRPPAPQHRIPHVSLLTLAGIAIFFCFFSSEGRHRQPWSSSASCCNFSSSTSACSTSAAPSRTCRAPSGSGSTRCRRWPRSPDSPTSCSRAPTSSASCCSPPCSLLSAQPSSSSVDPESDSGAPSSARRSRD